LFIIPFFCVHYGMFTFVHGIFVVTLFGGGMHGMRGFPTVSTFWNVMRENELGWAILGLAVSHGVSFVTNYIGKGEYQRVGLNQLMQQPYGRIMVMHIAILFGGFLVMALHSPTPALLLLVALKTAFDLGSHVGERKKFAATSTNPPVGDEVTSL